MAMLLTGLKRRLAALFKRDKLEQELDEELRYHLERDAEQHRKFGMDQTAAQYAALRAFGNVESSKEECRDARGIKFLDDLIRDIRYSFRLLVKNPTFSFVAILTLALGIGANSAIFSLVDAVLLRSLPVKEPEKLVLFGKGIDIGLTDGFPNDSPDLFSYPFYKDVQQQAGVFSDVGALLSIAWTVHGLAGSHDVVPRRMEVQLVSGSYFNVLGIDPDRGRLISEEDDKVPGMHPVAVVSDAWWKQQFGGNDNVIGESIRIDKTAYTIIGVAPKGFTGTTVGQAPDVWIPLAMEPQLPPHWNGRDQRNFQSLFLIGRLKEGVSREQANAVVNVLYKRFLQDLAGPQPSADVRQRMNASVELTPAGKGIDGVRRDFALPLRVLMVVVAIILLIACANIANLLLARTAVRNREIVLRLALGARRISLIRQFITESLILALIAGAAGVLLAWWGTHLLVAMASSGPRPLPLDVTLNFRVLGFTLLVSVLSAVVFGTAPALRATRGDLNTTLKDGKGALRPSTQNRLGRSLVVAQVALSLMLMIGAGLFVRTLRNLEDIPTGFNAQNVALFNIDTASTGYNDEQIGKLQVEAEDRVKQVSGVEAAAFSFLTFNQGGWTSPLFTRDETPPQGEARVVRQNVVGEDYFKAMGVQLVSGRAFNRFDTAQSQKVAVVSETLAQHFYPNTSPLGKHFGKSAESTGAVEIIGVVKDVKYHTLTEDSRPMVYFPLTQMPQPVNNFVVRVSSDSVIPAVRQALRNFNSNLPIDDVVSLEDHVSRSLAQQKLIARVASFFGVLALVLASIGLYGVLAYAVAQRRNEIGIRVALGASSADVLKLVLRNGMTMTVIGLVLGVGGALALTRLVATLLFGVTPTDLLTFVGVSMTLVVVALLACYIPARMATQVDPLTALRDE